MWRSRFLLLAACLLAVFMPSRESLWIDEFATYTYLTPPSFSAWLDRLVHDRFSEALMPLGMFSAWCFSRLLGTGEWAMRAPNIFWTWVALAAVAVIGRLWKTPWAPLLFAVQPFVWFYANEARPYSMQIAWGAWLAAGAVAIVHRRDCRGWPLWSLIVASAALIATTLFGILTVGAVFLALIWSWRRDRFPIPRPAWILLGALFVWSAGLGFYYLHTLAAGAKGAKLWTPGFSNLFFAFYEFAGYQGLGPPRSELRTLARATGGVKTLLTHFGPTLVGLGVMTLGLGSLALSLWRLRGRDERAGRVVVPLTVCLLAAAATYLLAKVANFPFWGRHLSPMFPFYFCLVLVGLAALLRPTGALRAGSWGRPVMAGLLAVLWLTSSLVLHWLPAHAKDDYREAARLARRSLGQGHRVWWCASEDLYYGLPLAKVPEDQSHAWLLDSPSAESLDRLPPPDLIILSKPDVFDLGSVMPPYLAAHGYRLAAHPNAFTVWERSSP